MRIKQLIKQYLEYLEFEKNKSESTLKNYTRYLDKFNKFAGNIKTERITYELVRNFIAQQKHNGYNPNYINSVVLALRSFLRYANIHNIPCVNFFMIELGHRVKRNVVYLEKTELKKLLKAPDIRTEKGLRDRTIMELLLSTGLRVGELINLKRDQLTENNCISINGKGNVIRLVFISKRARWWLNKYLKTRNDNSPVLFCKYKGVESDLSPRTIQRLIKEYSCIAGITKDVSPHTLRHSLAVNLLENGADIFYIKEILGHKDIGTTQIYLHATNKRLQEIHEKFHIL